MTWINNIRGKICTSSSQLFHGKKQTEWKLKVYTM